MSQGQRVVYSIAALALSLLLSSGFAVWYTGHVNQQWCGTLAVLTQNDPRLLPPPTTKSGKSSRPQQVETYDQLVRQRKSFHCG